MRSPCRTLNLLRSQPSSARRQLAIWQISSTETAGHRGMQTLVSQCSSVACRSHGWPCFACYDLCILAIARDLSSSLRTCVTALALHLQASLGLSTPSDTSHFKPDFFAQSLYLSHVVKLGVERCRRYLLVSRSTVIVPRQWTVAQAPHGLQHLELLLRLQ